MTIDKQNVGVANPNSLMNITHSLRPTTGVDLMQVSIEQKHRAGGVAYLSHRHMIQVCVHAVTYLAGFPVPRGIPDTEEWRFTLSVGV